VQSATPLLDTGKLMCIVMHDGARSESLLIGKPPQGIFLLISHLADVWTPHIVASAFLIYKEYDRIHQTIRTNTIYRQDF
jgi:hypothetical protein